MVEMYKIKPWLAYVIFIGLDTICVGMGMGVPIFCIFFGFVVGWYIARAAILRTGKTDKVIATFLPNAVATASYTFVLMVLIWGVWFMSSLGSNLDYANSGIPMILFEPEASFIGWELLMICISPILQVLTTLFGAHIILLRWLKQRNPMISNSANNV